MNKKHQMFQPLFDAYDKASNEATDCFIASLEARKNGKTAIANYLENKMYPKLQKRSYELFRKFSDAVNRT